MPAGKPFRLRRRIGTLLSRGTGPTGRADHPIRNIGNCNLTKSTLICYQYMLSKGGRACPLPPSVLCELNVLQKNLIFDLQNFPIEGETPLTISLNPKMDVFWKTVQTALTPLAHRCTIFLFFLFSDICSKKTKFMTRISVQNKKILKISIQSMRQLIYTI